VDKFWVGCALISRINPDITGYINQILSLLEVVKDIAIAKQEMGSDKFTIKKQEMALSI
jgi:hypothetical protein